MRGPTETGPGAYFVRHPLSYRLAMLGAGSVCAYAIVRAARAAGKWASLRHLALAVVTGAQVAGMARVRRAARR